MTLKPRTLNPEPLELNVEGFSERFTFFIKPGIIILFNNESYI